MPTMKQMYRVDVVTPKGRRIGRINDVLVTPDAKRVVGYVIERPRLLMLWDRKDRYLAADRAKLDTERQVVEVSTQGGQWDAAAEKRLGLEWDATVIWMGMPVRTASGTRLGAVRDARYDYATGEITTIGLTGGLTADLAVGVRDVAGSQVRGFADGAIVVEDAVARIETDGGAAAAAGRGAAVAKQKAGEAAKSAVSYGKAAAKIAGKSQAGRKAAGFLRSLKDQVTDAMGDDEE